MAAVILKVVKVAVVVGFTVWLFRQVRNPSGWLGRRVVRAMNLGHSSMTNWGLQQVAIAEDSRILDIGCGGGLTVHKLAAMAHSGKVVGIDNSEASVAV